MKEYQSVPKWLHRLDRSILFDPARWPNREAVTRGVAIAVITVFLVLRLWQFDQFPQFFEDARKFYAGFKTAAGLPLYNDFQIGMMWGIRVAVWLIETAIFLGYIASYVTRAKAVSIAKGFMEVAFPMVVAGLPILMSFLPYNLPHWLPASSTRHLLYYLVIMGLIALGGVVNLVGLLTMRQAFTIMSEARTLVTSGIFRYVRHPLYTGHFIMFFGSMLLRLQIASISIYLAFLVGQVIRARIEERKLRTVFDDYGPYQQRTGMFWPKGFRAGPGKG